MWKTGVELLSLSISEVHFCSFAGIVLISLSAFLEFYCAFHGGMSGSYDPATGNGNWEPLLPAPPDAAAEIKAPCLLSVNAVAATA